MHILILGTSNSILQNGWATGLQRALPDAKIDNWSAGASPGIQFAEILSHDLDVYDVVIFDSLPNDEEYDANPHWWGTLGYSSPEFVDEIFYQILSTIACHCPLIILGITSKDYMSSPSNTFLRRKNLADRLGCPFLDVRALLEYHQCARGLSADDLYEDHPAHPKREIAHQIGFFLGNDLQANPVSPPLYSATDFSQEFTTINTFVSPHSSKRHYRNSRMDVDATIIPAGDKIQLNGQGLLIGLSLNAKHTNCALRFGVDGDLKLSLYYHTNFDKDKLQKIFLPIPNGIQATDLYVVSAIVDGCAAILSSQKPDTSIDQHLSLISVTFWSGWGRTAKRSGGDMVAVSGLNDRMMHKYRNWIAAGHDLAALAQIPTTLATVIFCSPQARILVKTFHGKYLSYDVISGYVEQVALTKIDDQMRYISVQVRIAGSKATLYISKGGIELSLDLDPSCKRLRICHLDAQSTGEFNLSHSGSHIHFSKNGEYLSAEKGGRIVCNRKLPSQWEEFHFVST